MGAVLLVALQGSETVKHYPRRLMGKEGTSKLPSYHLLSPDISVG